MTITHSKIVGVIGLGMLGASIVERLLNKGTKINVYNRSPSKAKSFESKGVKSFENPCSLANECDIIITCVTNFDSLKEIFFNKQGIADSNNSQLIIVDCTTIKPDQSLFCYELLKEKNGMTLLSAPVMGGPIDAKNGELLLMVSGDKKAYENIYDILIKISKNIFYLGEKNGISNSVKLALNLNIAAIYLALSEGIIFSMHSGIDPSVYLKIFNLSKLRTSISENKGIKILKNDFSPSFYLKHMFKDLNLVIETARALQLSLPITETSQKLFDKANTQDNLKDKDYSAIFQFLDGLNKYKADNQTKENIDL
jgi:3-hydroxyisobutyrate dehydrogenase